MARVPGPGSGKYNVLKTQPTQEQMHQWDSPERVRAVLRFCLFPSRVELLSGIVSTWAGRRGQGAGEGAGRSWVGWLPPGCLSCVQPKCGTLALNTCVCAFCCCSI